MKSRWLILLLSISFLSIPHYLSAAEPYLEFAQGLRERQYFDTALDYLEWAEAQPNVPPDIRDVLPYEKASTLLQAARIQRNPEKASEYLDRARAFLQEFVQKSPNHEKAGQANTDLANVLLQKGKVAVIQSRSPSNQGKKAEYQQEARDYFGQARKVFQAAHDQYEKQWKEFGVYINEGTEPEKFKARQKAEFKFIQAQLNLALVTYEEAQSYDRKSPEFNKTLKDAAAQFEAMNTKYRSMVAGLYARMYQGKCFEEQDDLQKALGFYNELLGHGQDGKVSPELRKLQDQVLQYKLICLNHDDRKDYQLVIQAANEWLTPQKGRTSIGRGIRWELARAQESLAQKPDLPAPEKDRLLRQALENAREINRYTGEYRDVSQAMITRLMVALNRPEGDPEDFVTAYGLSREAVDKIRPMKDVVDASRNPEDKQKLQQDLDLHLSETARLLRLAISLAKSDTDIQELNRVRYWLCYVNYLTGRSYDAAILGEYVARRYTRDEASGTIPLDAAYLAMAAYGQAYNNPTNQLKDFDIERMIDICNFITVSWPQSDKAIDAMMMLGRMYSQIGQPTEAASWFSKVPETAEQYLDAQLAAGQAFWAAYLATGNVPEEERPEAAVIAGYQTSAQGLLKSAIAKLEGKLAETEPLSDKLAFAKLTLAQMANGSGNFDEAIALLQTGPRPVTSVTGIKENEARPRTGPQSRIFAGETYRQLLRSYIGTQKTDEAQKVMAELEKIEVAGGSDVTQLYIELGKQFKEELDRLGKTNVDQYNKMLTSFDTFLTKMQSRPDGKTYNSIAWVGETYFALGQGITDKGKAADYFARAATAFKEILNGSFPDVSSQQLAAVKFRLVNCERYAGHYDEALTLIKEIVKERPNALDAQIEAAYVYQDWAASRAPDAEKYWDLAMLGNRSKKADAVPIWGWGQIGDRLDRQLATGPNKKYEDQVLEARYNLAFCRHNSALAQSKEQKKMELLERAERDLLYTAALRDIPEEWYVKYNALYRENQQQMGKIPENLVKGPPPPKPQPVVADTGNEKIENAPTEDNETTATETPKSSGMSMIGLLIFGLLAVGAVGGMVFMSTRPQKRVKVASYGGGAAGFTAPSPPRTAKTAAKPAAGKAPAAKPTAGKPGTKPAAKPATKPVAKPPAAEGAPAPQPKPKAP